MSKTINYFVEVIEISTGEIIKRHGPLSERQADRREDTFLNRLDLSKVSVRVMQEKADLG